MYSNAYVDPDTKKICRTQVVNADVRCWDFVTFLLFIYLFFSCASRMCTLICLFTLSN